MPILSKEPALCPSNLLTELGRESTNRQWWVLYTKSRQEKAVARALNAQEIPYYLPLVSRNVMIRGHRVTSYVPVFSSYVFVFGTMEERAASFKNNRISRVLPVPDPTGLCEDLARVQTMIETGCPLTVEARLMAGQRVRVHSGPLIGLEGTVLRRKQQTRLVVDVRMLQQGVSVEIDDFVLEPIEEVRRLAAVGRRAPLACAS